MTGAVVVVVVVDDDDDIFIRNFAKSLFIYIFIYRSIHSHREVRTATSIITVRGTSQHVQHTLAH